MSGELMHVFHQLGGIFCHGSAAHALPHRNANAGGFALEGTQHQAAVFHHIKTGPVNIRQVFPQQRSSVGHIGQRVPLAFGQGRQLGVHQAVHCLFFISCHG